MSVPLPPESEATPKVSVVVVSYNTKSDLLDCARSLETVVSLPFELIVVDNASRDGSAEAIRSAHPTAQVLVNPDNRGFARASNQGIRRSRAPYSLLLNSDAEVRPGAVEALTALLDAQPGIGVAGPRTRNADGTIQLSFGGDLTPLGEWRQRRVVLGIRKRDERVLRRVEQLASREHEPDWLSGSCLLARRSAIESVGLFDEAFFLYEEDADLCLRLRRAGWRVVFTPEAEVIHRQGRSGESAPGRSYLEYQRSHVRYYRKHMGSVLTLFLRAWLVATGFLRWLAPPAGPQDRPDALKLMGVGFRGR